MKPKEFKELRKSCFKTAKLAAEYYGKPVSTWYSWEGGYRPIDPLAIKALQDYRTNKYLRESIKRMTDLYI
jgi:hypothetical protein